MFNMGVGGGEMVRFPNRRKPTRGPVSSSSSGRLILPVGMRESTSVCCGDSRRESKDAI